MELIEFEREVGEQIIKQCRTTFQDQPSGYLHITNIRILWTKPAVRSVAISLPFSRINAIKTKKEQYEGKETPILAVTIHKEPHEREQTFVFRFIDPITMNKDHEGFHKLLLQSVKPYREQRKKKKLETKQINISKQRADLLARNEDLRIVYSKLVPKTLSEEEFWKSRSDMIEKENSLQHQRIGMSTAMLTTLKPNAETNKHIYRLTPQIIHQIFVEYPAVRDVYETVVPHKITEKEFWEKYFQSNYFHRIREQSSSSRHNVTSFDDIFLHCDSIPEDLVPKVKLSDVDHSIDLTFEEERSENYGAPMDSKMNIEILDKSISTIRRYNRHSALVLENPPTSIPTTQSKKKSKGNLAHIIGAKRPRELTEDEKNKKRLLPSMQEQTVLDDLEDTVKQDTVPLRIADQRRYFQSSSALNNSMEISGEDTLFKEYVESLDNWNATLDEGHVDDNTCFQALDAIINPPRSNEERKKEIELNEVIKAKLRADFLEANELLRHFWGCFPVSTRRKQKKLRRLEGILESYRETLGQKRDELVRSTHDQDKQYAKYILPIYNSVCTALRCYEEHKSKLENSKK